MESGYFFKMLLTKMVHSVLGLIRNTWVNQIQSYQD